MFENMRAAVETDRDAWLGDLPERYPPPPPPPPPLCPSFLPTFYPWFGHNLQSSSLLLLLLLFLPSCLATIIEPLLLGRCSSEWLRQSKERKKEPHWDY